MDATNQLEMLMREAGEGPVSGQWLAGRLQAIRDELAVSEEAKLRARVAELEAKLEGAQRELCATRGRGPRTPEAMAQHLAAVEAATTGRTDILGVVVTLVREAGPHCKVEVVSGYTARRDVSHEGLRHLLAETWGAWVVQVAEACEAGTCAICRGETLCH